MISLFSKITFQLPSRKMTRTKAYGETKHIHQLLTRHQNSELVLKHSHVKDQLRGSCQRLQTHLMVSEIYLTGRVLQAHSSYKQILQNSSNLISKKQRKYCVIALVERPLTNKMQKRKVFSDMGVQLDRKQDIYMILQTKAAMFSNIKGWIDSLR